MSTGAPAGTHIGTETELIRRFRVSREPLREAIRILEWQGLVVSSRGRSGGGLRVRASAGAAMAGMLRTYLQLSDISLGEVLESIAILQHLALEEAALRATAAQIAEIRNLILQARTPFVSVPADIAAIVRISEAIASLAPNPALRIFSDALRQTSVDFTLARRQPKTPRALMVALGFFTKILDALEMRNAKAATAAQDSFIKTTADRHSEFERRNRKVWNIHSFLLGDYTEALKHLPGRQKRAVKMAYDLAAFIRREGLAAGTRISAQSDVIMRHRLSRSTMREAMRLLEFFGVVEVRRGKEGGLRVIAPNPASILDFAQIYFHHTVTEQTDLVVIREHLEGAAARLCASKLSTAGLLAIRAKAEVVSGELSAESALSAARAIGDLIYELSENRSMLLFGRILNRVTARVSRGSGRLVHSPHFKRSVADCIAQLSIAYLKADKAEILDSLNVLRSLVRQFIVDTEGTELAATGANRPQGNIRL